MTTTTHHTPSTETTQERRERLAPHVVHARLNRDISKILSVSIQHFQEEKAEIDEKHFDVDGIISGRTSYRAPLAKMQAARPARGTEPELPNARILTTASRGNFIPSSHFYKMA